MTDLKNNINEVQNYIVIITQLLITGRHSEASGILPIMTKALTEVVMDLFDIFQKDTKKFSEDINFWSSQLDRITGVIEQEDYFRMIDVLYYETHQNLETYKEFN